MKPAYISNGFASLRLNVAVITFLVVALAASFVPLVSARGAIDQGPTSFGGSVATASDASRDELIVTYANEVVGVDESLGDMLPQSDADTLSDLGVENQDEVAASDGSSPNVTVVRLSEDADAEDVARQMEALPDVIAVQPNYSYSLMGVSVSDPQALEGQYYLERSGAFEAWEHGRSEGAVTVAVLDSGCNLEHEDLQGVVDAANAYDVTAERPLSQSGVANNGDAIGHGTLVAGIVGAHANNGVGIAGVSYNASILPVKVFDENGRCTTADIISAYDYLSGLIDSGQVPNLRVVNLSLGYYADSLEDADEALRASISSMRDNHGVLTVCAAGNGMDESGGTDKLCLPSDFEECLSVTALNAEGSEASFSNYNDEKDLSAYGESILSADKAGGYSAATGTSMAAPQVAGAAALLWAADGALDVSEVFDVLTSTASEIQGTRRSGTAGSLDVAAALAKVQGRDGVLADEGAYEHGSDLDKSSDGLQADASPQGGLKENSWRYKDGERIIGVTDDGAESGGIMPFAEERCVWTKHGNVWRSSEAGRTMEVRNAYAFGIDVSYHNGVIDWAAVKRSGVDFAILRCGWGDDWYSQDDTQFINNVRGCQNNGIRIGVYIYSYAKRAYGSESAESEANHVLRCLREAGLGNPASLSYPVYYDLEEESMGRVENRTLLADMAQVFCSKIAAAGYTPGVYSNLNWSNNYLTDSRFNNWSRWIAQYPASNNGLWETKYTGAYDIWQCMSNGSIGGINHNVDINFDYNGFDRVVWDANGARLPNADGSFAKNAWYTNGRGQTYYFGADTYAVVWLQEIENKLYYFNGDGTMHTGWLTWNHDGSRSYFGPDGVALAGWQTVDGKRYYFDESNHCRAPRWLQTIGGRLYYFDGECAMHTGWLTWNHDGSRSYFGPDGVALAGWQTVDGKRYYFDESNHCRAPRWLQTIGGRLYYFDGECAMHTGWLTWNHDGSRSYFGPDGVALAGWQTVDGKRYYFNPDNYFRGERWTRIIDGCVYYFNGDCSQHVGWLTWNHDGSRSYFDPSANGAAVSGWQTIDGKRYYFDEANYCRAPRWQQTIDGKRYYFDGECAMHTGWLTWNHDGSRSYFGPDGVALAGWQTVDGKRYYFNPDNYFRGERWTRIIDGCVYYFNGDCSQHVGWLTWNHDGSRSYFDPSANGAAVSGWQTIDGKRYYFDEANYCRTLRGQHTIEGCDYVFEEDGSLIEG